jgi:hypothetical protein
VIAAGGGPPDHLDAAPVGHVHVEQHHVGPDGRDGLGRLVHGCRLADDVEQGLELRMHAGAEELVVVNDQDGRRAQAPPPFPRRARS